MKEKLIKLYINKLTKEGLRVISVAYKNKNSDLGGLCFIGFVVIKDEIRNNASEGINLVESAGIQTVMITGDDKDTATNIAREVGLLKSSSDIILTSEEIEEALKKSANMIVSKVKNVLEQTPPELASDIINKGIILTGGGALTVGLDKLLESELKVPVKIAESPLTCVAEGTGILLDNINLIDR